MTRFAAAALALLTILSASIAIAQPVPVTQPPGPGAPKPGPVMPPPGPGAAQPVPPPTAPPPGVSPPRFVEVPTSPPAVGYYKSGGILVGADGVYPYDTGNWLLGGYDGLTRQYGTFVVVPTPWPSVGVSTWPDDSYAGHTKHRLFHRR